MLDACFSSAGPLNDLACDEKSTLKRWIAGHEDNAPVSSNQASVQLPFQRWFKFKEAFSPRFVLDTFDILGRTPRRCLDCFGGSGTTALTCQFVGVPSVTIEVNPFLADLIAAKLTTYSIERLQQDFLTVCRTASSYEPKPDLLLIGAPATMVEPGIGGRWIFNRDVAIAILRLRLAIEALTHPKSRALLRVVLGSLLVELSNATVNGKGRRYRKNWQRRDVIAADVEDRFERAFYTVFTDLCCYPNRRSTEFTLLRGDARKLLGAAGPFDAAIFSPPYPNSFDYTDIYNIELWMLGYLQGSSDNRRLRNATLRSHVQVRREFDTEPTGSRLRATYLELCQRRDDLWDRRLPEMVNSYFADMRCILVAIRRQIAEDGLAFMAVGNSQYAGILVDVPAILCQLAEGVGFDVHCSDAIRSMRTSAQQGGDHRLAESIVVLSPQS